MESDPTHLADLATKSVLADSRIGHHLGESLELLDPRIVKDRGMSASSGSIRSLGCTYLTTANKSARDMAKWEQRLLET